jgi:hypothetical protein
MSVRPIALVLALSLTACARDAGRAKEPPAAPPAPGAPAKPGARFFHGSPQEGFWVTHAADLDRLVVSGARLELSPAGEVLAAAWDPDLSQHADPLLGGLAVPERLGGGFAFWSARRFFRARAFTGALEPIRTGPVDSGIRGARAGLSSIIVSSQLGPRELLPGARALTPLRDPGVFDAVALSASRGLQIDVFGRALHTTDAGATWTDLSLLTGLGVRQIAVGESDLWLDTWQGRVRVTPAGKLEQVEIAQRGYDPSRGYQLVWKGTRADQRDGLPWGLHNASPIQLAVAAGAPVGDGTAFGVAPNVVVRVDLASGNVVSMSTDWISNSLSCQPVRAPDAVLFACVWDRSNGYGGYVLRSVGGAPPEIEATFTDEGSFVSDGEGAIGYLGSCLAKPHYLDPDDQSRYEPPNGEPVVPPILCVRKGPREWVERRVTVPAGATLLTWVPRRDGAAAAIVRDGDPLPPPVGAPAAVGESGVTVLRVHGDFQGWAVRRPSWMNDVGGLSGHVETRFRMRDDGGVDGWLYPAQDGSASTALGVSFDSRGAATVHPAAPDMITTAIGGRFALSFTRDGDLFESGDFGRTWRPAGKAPTPPSVWGSFACSSLGCSLGSIVRVGWGDSALAPRVSTDSFGEGDLEPARASLPRLSCAPRGAPVPVPPPPSAQSANPANTPSSARQTISTPWGDTIEIVRDASVPEPPQPPPPGVLPVTPPAPSAPPAPSTSAPAKKKPPPRATPAVLRTHSLYVRQVFSPHAATRVLNATDASFNAPRRSGVTPLLAPSGDVDLLVTGDQRELLVAGDRITAFPAPEPRRWFEPGTGLVMPNGRALVLGDSRRRLALEDHGPDVLQPPMYLGVERAQDRRRPLALARRDDGALGVLIFDGGGPETVGVALIDRLGATTSRVMKLAPWSTVVTADDPRCKKGADKDAFTALVVAETAAWLGLDPREIPGIQWNNNALLLVRWGKERVCLEALDAEMRERRVRGDMLRPFRLVARWGAHKEAGVTLRTRDLQQDLVCKIERPAQAGR